MQTQDPNPVSNRHPSGHPASTAASRRVALNPGDHMVQFYEDEAFLVESVGAYLAAGLRQGEAGVIIATPDHASALGAALAVRGLDTRALIDRGRLTFRDARQTLAAFMVDGWPDETRFQATVGALVAGCLANQEGLRAFGEMVALLWAEGNGPAAIRLEELWNGLGKGGGFSIFCAYPLAAFKDSRNSGHFERICREHHHVLPGAEQARSGSDPDGSRALALMRQKAESLENEIAGRRKAEEAGQRLAAIVEGSFDAIIGADLDGRITSWNKGAERLFGHAEAEVVGKPLTAYVRPGNPDEEKAVLHRLRAGEFIHPFDAVRLRTDGTRLDVSVTVSPIRDADGAIVGASKIVRDITERRRYEAALADKEDQLRQAQKMEAVGRLAGGIAHDFNNLLTAINGYSEMALSLHEAGEGDLREFLSEIKRSGERAASLTRQLLAYSRKQILAPTVFDLNATVSEMERMLRRLIGEDIDIRTELARDLHPVKADPGQVQQIILNLVLNARDAMPQGGRLLLATSNTAEGPEGSPAYLEAAGGSHVALTVSDTGVGMDDGVKARIFEPFFTTKEVGKGTGLGLSSVYGILKQSGGGISVESEPGRGSTFRILLPRAEPGADGAAGTGAAKPEPAGRRAGTILLVEDEDAVRRFVRRTLADRGYTLLEARNGAEALALAGRRGDLDLLLTDVVMPGISGGKLAETLRDMHPGLRVLFISGYPDNFTRPAGFPEPSVRFLQKPFGQTALQGLVREILEQPTLGRTA